MQIKAVDKNGTFEREQLQRNSDETADAAKKVKEDMLEKRMVIMLETSVELVIDKPLHCSAEDDIRDRTQRFLMRWAVYLQNLNEWIPLQETNAFHRRKRKGWNIILICSDPVRRPVLCVRVLVPFRMEDSSKFLLFLVLLVLCAACALRIC